MHVVIQVNLPFIGMFFGQDWGRVQIDFGICITGETRPLVIVLYGNVPRKSNPDFWIMKGRIYEIENGEG